MDLEKTNHNTSGASGRHRAHKMRGQVAIVIAVAMVVLIAFVGLAIDGGSMYAQRRTAQNSADAAALAATQKMLTLYDQMILVPANYYDVDGTADDDTAINNQITTYATTHGLTRSKLQAYYINDNKQVIGSADQQVGSYGAVPWASGGAKGIVVKSRADTDSFFMKLFGFNTVGASATTNAFMGIAVDSGDGFGVLPIGFFTTTSGIENMVIGQDYTLIDGNSLDGGDWGWLDFNDQGSSRTTVQKWINCGFNPVIDSLTKWNEFCTSDTGGSAYGPAQMWPCVDSSDSSCVETATSRFHFGYQTDGWWLLGSSGTVNSSCQDMAQMLSSAGDGAEFVIPMFDGTVSNPTRYHLRAFGNFIMQNSYVDCHVSDPGPGGGSHQHWHIEGVFDSFHVFSGTGRHGDLRHTSAHL